MERSSMNMKCENPVLDKEGNWHGRTTCRNKASYLVRWSKLPEEGTPDTFAYCRRCAMDRLGDLKSTESYTIARILY